MVLNSAYKKVRFIAPTLEAIAITGAYHIIAIGILGTILAGMKKGFAIEHSTDIIKIKLPIIGMDAA